MSRRLRDSNLLRLSWGSGPHARLATLRAAVALAIVGGPVMVFPDLLPESWRAIVVTMVTVAALSFAGIVFLPLKRSRGGLWLLIIALIASWSAMPTHDLGACRHFAGTGFGILCMAILATWCSTTERLLWAGLLFGGVSAGVLTVGLSGVSTQVLGFLGHGFFVPKALYSWLPGIQLGLPGLAGYGFVNPNALGGTALLLLPTCAGVIGAGLDATRYRRALIGIGGISTGVGVIVLVITQSRTAWTGALVALAVWLWRSGRLSGTGRKTVLAAVLVSAVIGFAALSVQRGPNPTVEGGFFRSPGVSLQVRFSMLEEGVARLARSPWLGIGISQFRVAPVTAARFGVVRDVAHVHNTLLQTALDVGLIGLGGYLLFFSSVVIQADRFSQRSSPVGRLVGGAGLSLVAVHVFGIGDAIALGAKVGLFQWVCAGLVVATSSLVLSPQASRSKGHY